jgi:hypothetical protein
MPVHHIRTTLAAPPIDGSSKPGWLVRIIQAVVPAANPDFTSLYPQVRHWLVEINDDGTPEREVGLNAEGIPVVAGPVGPNMGYWTDGSYQFNAEQHEPVAAQEFVNAWQQAVAAWQLGTGSRSDA